MASHYADEEDTQPIAVPDTAYLPNPVMVRASILAVVNLIAAFIGKDVLTTEQLEAVMICYGTVGPVVLGWWIKRHVNK